MNEEKIFSEILMDSKHLEPGIAQFSEFRHLMTCYQCALLEVKTKLDVLNAELSQNEDDNPIEDIKCRLKRPASILDKLKRKGLPLSIESMQKLSDIAGIRVICSFLDDIYLIRDYLVKQDDVRVIAEKDYIAHPKPNGYRSLHLILSVPIFLCNEKKYMPVEVQFRTIAMDFWASNEHKLTYKQEGEPDRSVTDALEKCAEAINLVDLAMLDIKKKVHP